MVQIQHLHVVFLLAPISCVCHQPTLLRVYSTSNSVIHPCFAIDFHLFHPPFSLSNRQHRQHRLCASRRQAKRPGVLLSIYLRCDRGIGTLELPSRSLTHSPDSPRPHLASDHNCPLSHCCRRCRCCCSFCCRRSAHKSLTLSCLTNTASSIVISSKKGYRCASTAALC